MIFQDEEDEPIWPMRDTDTKLTEHFAGIFKSERTQVKRHIIASPNLIAYIERFIQTRTG